MLRYAPSPTKDLNISDLRIAIFNYILSKQLNEDLVVRIDDYEKEKNIEGKDKEILELLNLFSIEYRNAVYQADSLKYHQKLAMQLMAQKKAFACFCGDVKLEELKQEAQKKGLPFSYDGFCETLSDDTVLNTNAPFTVRIKKPEEDIKFTDKLQGKNSFGPMEVDSFNILTHDKTPTYNYACALDDMLMNISTVIREDKYLIDTARQIHIRNSLAYDKELTYIHIPAISNADEYSIKYLIDEGFLPSAIANYLVLLGSVTPSDIFTLEDAIKWFKIENLSKESLEFDIEKLKEINKKHLESIDEMRLSKILGFADNDIGKLGKLFLEESSTIKELKEKINKVFDSKTNCDGFEEECQEIKRCLKDAPYIDNYDELKKYIIGKTKLDDKTLSNPLKYILIGNTTGPDISDVYPLIKNYLGEIVK